MIKANKKPIIFLIIAILLVCFTIFSVYSCGNSSNTNEPNNIGGSDNNSVNPADGRQTENSGEPAVQSVTAAEYNYPDMDGGGADFRIFAPTTTYGFYTNIASHSEQTGDVLDDSIYVRNRFLESKFNINIKEINADIAEMNSKIRKSVMTGEDQYDASFCPVNFGSNIGKPITEGIFLNMRSIPTINLDEKWWNQTILKEGSFGSGNKIFYAGCDIDIMTLQSVLCIFFNQDMMTKLGLDLPYNAVREGKWTLDLLNQYMKSGANLNGDADWGFKLSGSSTYGLASYDNAAVALLGGSGEQFVVKDENGMPRLGIESERFINVVNKIKDMLTVKGNYLYANGAPASGNHFEPIFKSGRALMTIGELKIADIMRDMEATFGILPNPKYDETQKDYYTHLIVATPLLVIPATNTKPDFTGAVLDAMAYLSAKDVTPVFFDITVSQKQLRNEDSIDMLQIIKSSGSFDVGSAYGWTSIFYDSLRSSLGQGISFNVVSAIDKNRDKMNSNIANTMEFFK